MQRKHYKGTWQENRAFSPAVATTGGRTIWMAGQGATHSKEGKSLAGDFDAQTHESFRLLAETLKTVGGSLNDIVTMTVYVIDARYGDRFVELRKVYFSDGFPASALITCAGFAKPEMMVEIMPIAVVAD